MYHVHPHVSYGIGCTMCILIVSSCILWYCMYYVHPIVSSCILWYCMYYINLIVSSCTVWYCMYYIHTIVSLCTLWYGMYYIHTIVSSCTLWYCMYYTSYCIHMYPMVLHVLCVEKGYCISRFWRRT